MNPSMEEFVQIYEECADAIFRHCYFRLFERELARDVTQETFMRTWKYLAAGGNIRNMRAFLYRIANNLIIDISRKRKTTSLHAIQEKGFDLRHDDPGTSVLRLDAKVALSYLALLDEKYREPVVMRYIDELSIKEIASLLQESESTISVRIHRGVQKLCDLLER